LKKNIEIYMILLFFIFNHIGCSDSDKLNPPKAEKVKKELTIHDDTRIDNYYWLKDKENKKVIDYLEAENEYANLSMAHTKDFQNGLYSEICSRIKQTDETVPYKLNGYYYYKRYVPGKEYPIHCRKKNLYADEKILLDVNKLAKGKSFSKISGLEVSPNNKLLAYGEDYISRRKYTIRFKDLKTGKILEDKLLNTNGYATWANDNKTVFYTKKDETLRSFKIFKHILGSDPKNDTEVYHESDSTFSTYVEKSKSQKYIFIHCESTLSTESRYLDANNPNGKFKLIQKRENNLEYHPEHFGKKFYIRTNFKAENFKIVSTLITKSSKKNWKDIIPHKDDVLVEDFEIFEKYLVVDERQNGVSKLRVKDWKNKADYFVEFDDPAYKVYMSKNLEFNTPVLRYVYSSLNTPASTFNYNMNSRKNKLLKIDEIGGKFNKDDYISERLFAVAKDGNKIPISLVYKNELKKQEGNPLLLYAYGSYGYSRDADFRSHRLSLLDRGFIYAIAHVRGGQEMGRWWYEDGKLLNKKNTFSDFIACAEHLINEKYTTEKMLFARGGSAGGLLMGAILNMSPGLFKGVIANVPWLDVITTMLDPDIPLTSSEYDEWGDPNKKEYYDYMLSYSPYDQVSAQDYPATLVTTGLHDSQVQYWEPAKWVAKLRELKTDDNLLLLVTDMESGHGGASGRFKQHKDTALEYAFILDQVGIKK